RGRLAVDVRRLPRQALLEDRQVGRLVVEAPLGHRVEDAGPAAGRLDLHRRVLQGDEAVGQVAAVAPTHDGDAVRVGDALFDEVLDAGENVLDLDVVLVTDEVGDELVAVAGGPAVVGEQGGVAVGGEVQPAVVRVVVQVRVAGRGRPAVDADHERQLV